jgi:hypothetical protein
MRSKVVLTLLVIGFFTTQAIADELVNVKATGSAQIVSKNQAGAKKTAIEDAKRMAVEQVGSEIIAETVVENFELVKDVIVTKISGYVKGFDIIEESCDAKRCFVTIDAKVSAGALKDDATLIYKAMDKPRIMVLIPETNPAGEVEIKSSLAENTVMDYLKMKGFELVDRNQALANIETDKLKAAVSGDEKAAINLGARAGAEVIVVGTANIGKPESIRDIIYASTPTISVRAINTGNASIYATATEVGKGQGGTPDQAQKLALQDTSKIVGKQIFGKIIQAWNLEKLNGMPVELVITGATFSKLKTLKSKLSAFDEVKDVVQRDFSAPSATLTVYVIGDANRLAELIDGKNIGEVTGVNPGKVTIKLK